MKRTSITCLLALGLLGSGCATTPKAEPPAVPPPVPTLPAPAAPAVSRGPLGVTDVAQMAQAHVSDDVILAQIQATGATFRLSAEDIIWLKQNGVSDRVIQQMQASGAAAPGPIAIVAPAPVYVVDPPPRVYVGYGFYRRRYW
jgi:hypothetical protein